MAAHQAPCPWDSPGKNAGMGCHFLLQCMKVKTESEVAQSCPTLSDPMEGSPPGSSIHGIFQARVLEWVAIAWGGVNTWVVVIFSVGFSLSLVCFHWSIIDLQCCVTFRYSKMIQLYIHRHLFFFRFFTFISYYEILTIVPYSAIQ